MSESTTASYKKQLALLPALGACNDTVNRSNHRQRGPLPTDQKTGAISLCFKVGETDGRLISVECGRNHVEGTLFGTLTCLLYCILEIVTMYCI